MFNYPLSKLGCTFTQFFQYRIFILFISYFEKIILVHCHLVMNVFSGVLLLFQGILIENTLWFEADWRTVRGEFALLVCPHYADLPLENKVICSPLDMEILFPDISSYTREDYFSLGLLSFRSVPSDRCAWSKKLGSGSIVWLR